MECQLAKVTKLQWKLNRATFVYIAFWNAMKYIITPMLVYSFMFDNQLIVVNSSDTNLFYGVFAVFYIWSWINLIRSPPMYQDTQLLEINANTRTSESSP